MATPAPEFQSLIVMTVRTELDLRGMGRPARLDCAEKQLAVGPGSGEISSGAGFSRGVVSDASRDDASRRGDYLGLLNAPADGAASS